MTNISAMNENQNEILTKSITPLFFKFGIANVISLLALSSASMIDAMFVGNFCGKESLAAVNLISPVMSLMSGLNLVFGSGGSVRVGKYLGENRFDKAHAMFTKTVVAVSSVMIFFSVFFFVFAEEVTAFLGAEEGPLHSLAAAYLRAVSPFFLTWGLVYTFSLFIRVDGRPKLATFGLLSTAVINIALDALFIVGFQWGVSGAALATGLSSVGPTAVFLVYILFFSKNLKLKRPDGRWHELLLAAFNGSSEFLSEISAVGNFGGSGGFSLQPDYDCRFRNGRGRCLYGNQLHFMVRANDFVRRQRRHYSVGFCQLRRRAPRPNPRNFKNFEDNRVCLFRRLYSVLNVFRRRGGSSLFGRQIFEGV